MNRHEFITKLNGKLFLLTESERRDIIDEYLGHIDMKMQNGKTEEEAIKDFGDIDQLADEILQAYHIDNSRVKTKTFDMYIKQFVDYISKATEKLLSFSAREIAQVIVEFIILLIVISILRWPFEIIASLLSGLFSWLPHFIYSPIHSVLDLLCSLASLAIGFLLIYQFINKRIMDATPSFTNQSVQRTAKKSETAKKQGADNFASQSDEPQQSLVDDGEYAQQNYDYSYAEADYRQKNSAGDFVINLVVIALKIMLFIIVWIPCAAVTIAGIVCTVLASVLYFTSGIGFIGLCLIGAGCCVIGISFTVWLTQVITGEKKNA